MSALKALSSLGGCVQAATSDDSHDASHYRVLPEAVVRVEAADQVYETLSIAAAEDLKVRARGGATGLAGGCVGDGIQIDLRELNALEIDSQQRLARVGPGVTLDQLNKAAAKYGLMFGPDVSSSLRATLGGMIANDSCGSRSPRYGRTSRHVERLTLALAGGEALDWKRGQQPARSLEVHEALVEKADLIRAAFPPLDRRVAGYRLDHWLKEPTDPGVLAGTEGTLGIVVAAELDLVPLATGRVVAAGWCRDVAEAADVADEFRSTQPDSVEILDAQIFAMGQRAAGTNVLDRANSSDATEAAYWVIAEWSDLASRGLSLDSVRRCVSRIGDCRIVANGEAEHMRRLRKAGLPALLKEGGDQVPATIIEDLSVPPNRLRDLLSQLSEVFLDFATVPVIYGHAAAGCLHIRPRLKLTQRSDWQRALELQEAATCVALGLGGSSTGEHGDGRLRSHLLPDIYGTEIAALFARVKASFDPNSMLNPGVIVNPVDPRDGFDPAFFGRLRALNAI